MKRPARWAQGPDKPLNTTPLEMPLGSIQPTPLHELIARMVQQHVEAQSDEEFGTLEDEDDFEPENEALLDLSPYTLEDLPDEPVLPPPPPEEEIEANLEQQTGDPPDPNAAEPAQP